MSSGTICLSFDFDAIALWVSRGITTGTPVSRGEFGVIAIPRILRLLKERDLTATFFIPGHTIASFPESCQQIVDDGHEIGLHGWAHENISVLERNEEEDILNRSIDAVHRLTGTRPRGFRSPAWDVSENTLPLLQDAGIEYDSSLMSNDYTPFRPRIGDTVTADRVEFGVESRLVELPVSWTVDDYPQFEYLRMPGLLMPGLRVPDDVFRNWTDDIRYMERMIDHGVFTVTFHPQVSGRGHRLLALEGWLDSLIERGLRFSRMDAVAESFNNGAELGVWRPAVDGSDE